MSNRPVKAGKTSVPDNFDVSRFDDWKVSQYPAGMVGVAGNSVLYETGGWRSVRPEWNSEKCKQCLLCWMNCPDSSILIANDLNAGIDYDHCKGCGVCAVECRFEAMTMHPEHAEGHLEPEESAEREPEITEGA